MGKIIEIQDSLREEADNILDKLNLLDFLSKFGNVKIVGSYALGLMTWKDLDIDVAVDESKEDDYFQAVQFLFGNPEVKKLVLSDNRSLSENLKSQGIPESMYLGVFTKAKDGEEWKIDIRFVRDSLVRTEKYIEEIKSKLDDEKREIILEIKSIACKHPKYINKEIFSVDVYSSVLDGKVKSFDDFEKYLNGKGIYL